MVSASTANQSGSHDICTCREDRPATRADVIAMDAALRTKDTMGGNARRLPPQPRHPAYDMAAVVTIDAR